MTVKYKVLKDFQLITEDKKIIIIKSKTIIEDYTFKNKNDIVKVPVEVIKNNLDYFALFDWKEELQSFLRTNKIPQPAVITKKIVPFIESLMEDNVGGIKEVIIEKEVIKEVVVEKPKIVEKEVIVEKPKIIEKEVILEKIVNDDSASIELQNRLNKISLKEKQLDKELESNNQKELELENLQKELNKMQESLALKTNEINNKEIFLQDKEKELTEKEQYLSDKEANLSDYISLSKLNQRVQQFRMEGKVMDVYELLINSLR